MDTTDVYIAGVDLSTFKKGLSELSLNSYSATVVLENAVDSFAESGVFLLNGTELARLSYDRDYSQQLTDRYCQSEVCYFVYALNLVS